MAQQYVTITELQRLGIPGDAYAGKSNADLNAALLAASVVADSYISKRYTLPLVSWGDDLRYHVAQLASLTLLVNRGFRPGSGADEVAVDAKNDARQWFRDVATGLVELAECVDSTPTVDEQGAQVGSDEPMSWRITTGPRST
jgi:phage gp36-like protein